MRVPRKLARIALVFSLGLVCPCWADSTGTGFFITSDGMLLTNFHVIDGAKEIFVRRGDDLFQAKVIKQNEENDIAVLKLIGDSSDDIKPLTLSRDTSTVRRLDRVFTFGFPDPETLGVNPKATDGAINALSGIKDDPTHFQMSVPIQPGNSGGPLIDLEGNVIGLTTATINAINRIEEKNYVPQNINYSVKIEHAIKLLGPEVKLPKPKLGKREIGELADSAANSVALIISLSGADTAGDGKAKPDVSSRVVEEPAGDGGSWLVPDSNERFLEDGELAGADPALLWRARNEIFARHGFIFGTPEGKALAITLGEEYRPKTRNMTAIYKKFNRFELYNIGRLQMFEQAAKARSGTGGKSKGRGQSPWVFPDSALRKLTQSDLKGLSKAQLWIARNEIYARRGYIFSSKKGKDYSSGLGSAYRGVTSDVGVIESNFNKLERANIDLIRRNEKGG